MSVQRRLAEDNYLSQTLPPKGADHAFYVGSLPGRARSRKHFLHAHGFHIFPKFTAEDQVARNLLKGESVPQLLHGPLGRGMGGDIEVQDPPSVVSQNQEHPQDLKPGLSVL